MHFSSVKARGMFECWMLIPLFDHKIYKWDKVLSHVKSSTKAVAAVYTCIHTQSRRDHRLLFHQVGQWKSHPTKSKLCYTWKMHTWLGCAFKYISSSLGGLLLGDVLCSQNYNVLLWMLHCAPWLLLYRHNIQTIRCGSSQRSVQISKNPTLDMSVSMLPASEL